MKRGLGLMLFGLLSLTQTAQADMLGRLFFTPAERQKMDDLQVQREHNVQIANMFNNTEEEASHRSVTSVNGLIQSSTGRRTAWINGKEQRNAPGNRANSVPIALPGKAQSLEVKVGQRVIVDGQVEQPVSPPPEASQ